MATSQTPPSIDPAESAQLQEIITNLQNFINEYIIFVDPFSPTGPRAVSPMIPGRYHEELRNAWKDLQSVFNDVNSIVGSDNFPQQQRIEAGLTGNQLKLKYKICKEAHDSVRDFYVEQELDAKPKDKSFFKKLRGYCKRFFQGSNIVISSISKSIPYGEAIREFIDGIVWLGDRILGTSD